MRRTIFALALVFASIMALAVANRPSYGEGTVVSCSPVEVGMRKGQQTTVNVTVTDMFDPGIYSFEFKIYYNNTLLTAMSAEIPADHMLKPSKPANIFVVDSGTINQDQGFVSFAATLLGEEPGKVGSGTLATIVFRSTERGNGTLEFRDLVLVDPTATPYPSTAYSVQPVSVVIDGAGGGPDLNGDGEINIEDIAQAALAFATTPEHPRWDPAADLNKDGEVNIKDLVLIAAAWNKALVA